MLNPGKLPDYLTVEQLRDILNIGQATAYRLLRKNKIPHVKIGVQYRIPVKALEDLIYKGDEHK